MISHWQTGEKDETIEIYFQMSNELSFVLTSPSILWKQNPTDLNIGMFKWVKNNFATITQIYNE